MMEIIEIDDDLDEFLKLAEEVYREDPVWCGESGEYLEASIAYARATGCKTRLFILNDTKPLVRASVSIDPIGDRGYIGHFEALENCDEAVLLLFSNLEKLLKDEGIKTITGPRSDIMSLGLQIEGFDLPQTWRTPHNPSYYQKYFEANGYVKKEDLLTFIMKKETPMESFPEIEGINIRNFNREDLENEIITFNRLNNTIFSSHENFIPRTLEEDMMIIGAMIPFIDDDLVLIAEKDKQPIGLLICVPDHNQMLKENRITRARLITIGLLEEYTRKGIGAMMGKVLKKNLLKKGIDQLEGSWVLESNLPPQKGAESIGASIGRVFRVYQKEI